MGERQVYRRELKVEREEKASRAVGGDLDRGG
jgi:hypothetical protein